MRKEAVMVFLSFALLSCHTKMDKEGGPFRAERVSRTASFVANSNVEQVFPLFGAFEERKWAPKWAPILVYPDEEIIEEGTTFKIKTHGHGHGHGGESEYLWIVTKFEPLSYTIQYLVTTSNRFWTITLVCEPLDGASATKATVTYSFTGLNAKGNELNKESLERMYQNDLQDWAEAINKYLQTLSK